MAVDTKLTRGLMFGFEGLNSTEFVLNGDPDALNNNRFIDLDDVAGLDFPGLKSSDLEYSGAHGGFYSANFFNKRTVVFSGTIYGGSVAVDAFIDYIKLTLYTINTPTKLWYTTGSNVKRYLVAKPSGFEYNITNTFGANYADFVMSFVCMDPRSYQDIANVGGTGTATKVVVNNGNIESDFSVSVGTTCTSITVSTGANNYVTLAPVGGVAFTINGDTRSIFASGYKSAWITAKKNWPILSSGSNSIVITVAPATVTYTLTNLKSAWV